MRAREPDLAGHVTRDGVEVAYEVFGAGTRTVVFLPAARVASSVPFLRHGESRSSYH